MKILKERARNRTIKELDWKKEEGQKQKKRKKFD